MELALATARAKRSCVDTGYAEDGYLKYFVNASNKAMEPTMHRGYHARMTAVETATRYFTEAYETGQVVVLGAGLDTAYWRAHKKKFGGKYFECDADAVTKFKESRIRRTAELAVDDAKYVLVACDLRKWADVEAALTVVGVDKKKPTLFVAEAVLAYAPPETFEAALDYAAGFDASAFVHYDVVASKDRFGRQMLDSFVQRGWPLHAAAESVDAYRARFSQRFDDVDARDMHAVYSTLVLGVPNERKRLNSLEIFDDPDEFKLIMQHASFLVAAKGPLVQRFLLPFRARLDAPVVPDPPLEANYLNPLPPPPPHASSADATPQPENPSAPASGDPPDSSSSSS